MSVCLGNNPRGRGTVVRQGCRPLTSARPLQTLYFLSSLSPVVLKKRKEVASACAQVEGAECRLVFPALLAQTGWGSWEGAGVPKRGNTSPPPHWPLQPTAPPAPLSPGTSQEGEPVSPFECVKELKEPVPPNKAEHPLA